MQRKIITRGNLLLKEWLKKKNMLQKDLAIDLETSFSVVNRWVLGKVKPRIDTAVKIEKITKGYVPAISWADISSQMNGKRRKKDQQNDKSYHKKKSNKKTKS